MSTSVSLGVGSVIGVGVPASLTVVSANPGVVSVENDGQGNLTVKGVSSGKTEVIVLAGDFTTIVSVEVVAGMAPTAASTAASTPAKPASVAPAHK